MIRVVVGKSPGVVLRHSLLRPCQHRDRVAEWELVMTSGLMVSAATVSACTGTAEVAKKSSVGTLPDDTTAGEIQMRLLNFLTNEASDGTPQSFHSNAIKIRRGYISDLESTITGLPTPACQFYCLKNYSRSFSDSVCSDRLDLVCGYDNGSYRQNEGCDHHAQQRRELSHECSRVAWKEKREGESKVQACCHRPCKCSITHSAPNT